MEIKYRVTFEMLNLLDSFIYKDLNFFHYIVQGTINSFALAKIWKEIWQCH